MDGETNIAYRRRAGRPSRWVSAKIQLITTLGLLCGSLFVACIVHAAQTQAGRTWPIAEPDALAEIEARVAGAPRDMSRQFGARRGWSALKAADLGVATRDVRRTVVPFFTLDFDITLPDGKILYPKGFSFNPLTYVKLPQHLVIVHPRDLGWALRTARPSDFILLAAHDGDNGDVIDLAEKSNRAIFILEDRVKARLGLTVAPVIVTQIGTALQLTEYGPKSRIPATGAPHE